MSNFLLKMILRSLIIVISFSAFPLFATATTVQTFSGTEYLELVPFSEPDPAVFSLSPETAKKIFFHLFFEVSAIEIFVLQISGY